MIKHLHYSMQLLCQSTNWTVQLLSGFSAWLSYEIVALGVEGVEGDYALGFVKLINSRSLAQKDRPDFQCDFVLPSDQIWFLCCF